MFNWFSPRCPLDVREKVWTEQRMQWLIEQFGLNELRQTTVILPTEDFFPELCQAPDWEVQDVLNRVCRYMGVEPDSFDLIVHADNHAPLFEDLYDLNARTTIHVIDLELQDLNLLIASMARQISWDYLQRENLLDSQVPDRASIAELFTVVRGIGVFAANASVIQQTRDNGMWSWWKIFRFGYLPARIFGYAYALFAWIRHEVTPSWSGYFRADAAAAFSQGLKYLSKTEDCLIDRDRAERIPDRSSLASLISDLEAESDSVRLAALWELRKPSQDRLKAIDRVCQCLHHENPILRCEAAETLGIIGCTDDAVLAELMSQLNSPDGTVRASCISALGELRPSLQFQGPDGASLFEQFRILQEDQNPNVLLATAGALAKFGTAVELFAPPVLQLLVQSVVRCDFLKTDFLAKNLISIVSDLDAFLTDRLNETDAELRSQVIDAVKDVIDDDG